MLVDVLLDRTNEVINRIERATRDCLGGQVTEESLDPVHAKYVRSWMDSALWQRPSLSDSSGSGLEVFLAVSFEPPAHVVCYLSADVDPDAARPFQSQADPVGHSGHTSVLPSAV
jgi:hypothetical protein